MQVYDIINKNYEDTDIYWQYHSYFGKIAEPFWILDPFMEYDSDSHLVFDKIDQYKLYEFH